MLVEGLMMDESREEVERASGLVERNHVTSVVDAHEGQPVGSARAACLLAVHQPRGVARVSQARGSRPAQTPQPLVLTVVVADLSERQVHTDTHAKSVGDSGPQIE